MLVPRCVSAAALRFSRVGSPGLDRPSGGMGGDSNDDGPLVISACVRGVVPGDATGHGLPPVSLGLEDSVPRGVSAVVRRILCARGLGAGLPASGGWAGLNPRCAAAARYAPAPQTFDERRTANSDPGTTSRPSSGNPACLRDHVCLALSDNVLSSLDARASARVCRHSSCLGHRHLWLWRPRRAQPAAARTVC